MTLKQRVFLFFVPKLVWLIIWFLYLSNKKEYYVKDEEFLRKNQLIAAFWHRDPLFWGIFYKKYKKKGETVTIQSRHFDGRVVGEVMRLFGLGRIYGSSSKGGVSVLKESLRVLEEGKSIAITPDGPRGPIYSIASGAITMSQKSGVPIILFSTYPSKYWELKSWDRFVIPKPFGTIKFYVSEPIFVDMLSLAEAKELIRERLLSNAW